MRAWLHRSMVAAVAALVLVAAPPLPRVTLHATAIPGMFDPSPLLTGATNRSGWICDHSDLGPTVSFAEMNLGPTSTGDFLVMVGGSYYDDAGNGGLPWTASDPTYSNTFSTSANVTDGSGAFGHAQIWWSANVTGGANHTLRLTESGNHNVVIGCASAWSGMPSASTLDTFAKSGYTAPAGTFTSGASGTVAHDDELLIGINHEFDNRTITSTGTLTTTASQNHPSNGDAFHVGDAVISTGSHTTYAYTGTYNTTPTLSTTTVLATFEANAPGAGPPPGASTLMLLGMGGRRR